MTRTYPQICKVRDLNYEVELKVDITFRKVIVLKPHNSPKVVIEETDPKILHNVYLGKLPVMVGSKWCKLIDMPTPE